MEMFLQRITDWVAKYGAVFSILLWSIICACFAISFFKERGIVKSKKENRIISDFIPNKDHSVYERTDIEKAMEIMLSLPSLRNDFVKMMGDIDIKALTIQAETEKERNGLNDIKENKSQSIIMIANKNDKYLKILAEFENIYLYTLRSYNNLHINDEDINEKKVYMEESKIYINKTENRQEQEQKEFKIIKKMAL